MDQGLLLIEWVHQEFSDFASSLRDLFFARPIIAIAASTAFCYFLWYRVSAVRKPRVYCKEGSLRSFLMNNCDILAENYWPTWWAVNCHLCTIARSILQSRPKNMVYERHKVTLPDGGLLSLDFDPNPMLSDSSPVLLILPGLTGDSYMNYVYYMLQDAHRTGYRPVVFNQRGTGGVPLITARLFAATNTEDLEFVIDYIKSLYPKAPVVALGVSLGGIILSHYVSNSGGNCALSAAITISTPLHPPSSQESLEKKWFNKKVYIDFLVGNMLRIVERNSHVLKRHPSFDLKRVKRINSLSAFDAAITAPLFGYPSEVEYYEDSCLVDKIRRIEIPYIAIVSEDDPFIPIDPFPVDKFSENPNTFLILAKHGGHFGFMEGIFPRGGNWMNRVNQQLLESLKTFCRM